MLRCGGGSRATTGGYESPEISQIERETVSSSIFKVKKSGLTVKEINIDPSYRNEIDSSANDEIPDIEPKILHKASNVKTARQEDVEKRITTNRHGIHNRRNNCRLNSTFQSFTPVMTLFKTG